MMKIKIERIEEGAVESARYRAQGYKMNFKWDRKPTCVKYVIMVQKRAENDVDANLRCT